MQYDNYATLNGGNLSKFGNIVGGRMEKFAAGNGIIENCTVDCTGLNIGAAVCNWIESYNIVNMTVICKTFGAYGFTSWGGSGKAACPAGVTVIGDMR